MRRDPLLREAALPLQGAAGQLDAGLGLPCSPRARPGPGFAARPAPGPRAPAGRAPRARGRPARTTGAADLRIGALVDPQLAEHGRALAARPRLHHGRGEPEVAQHLPLDLDRRGPCRRRGPRLRPSVSAWARGRRSGRTLRPVAAPSRPCHPPPATTPAQHAPLHRSTPASRLQYRPGLPPPRRAAPGARRAPPPSRAARGAARPARSGRPRSCGGPGRRCRPAPRAAPAARPPPSGAASRPSSAAWTSLRSGQPQGLQLVPDPVASAPARLRRAS